MKKILVQVSFVDDNFYNGIYLDSSFVDKWCFKKSFLMKCNFKNCKKMNFCLDFEEEMEEGVENIWVFMKELLF